MWVGTNLRCCPPGIPRGGVWHAESYATTKCSVQRTRKYSGDAVTVHKKDGGLFSYNELSNRWMSLCDWCRDMGMGYFKALKAASALTAHYAECSYFGAMAVDPRHGTQLLRCAPCVLKAMGLWLEAAVGCLTRFIWAGSPRTLTRTNVLRAAT